MTELVNRRLLCPGPVNVDPRIADALTAFEICHREDEFEDLLVSLTGGLLEVAALSPSTHAAVVVTGSGSAGNEAVLGSAVPEGGRVLVVSNGEFGERLAKTAAHLHGHVTHLAFDWAEPIDLARVERALSEGPFSLVAMVHHETSTGMLNPVVEVARRCEEAGTRLFVDAVSSFAADPLEIDVAGIAFVVTSAGKALSAYPGLSVVFGRHEDFQALDGIRAKSQYLDLGRHYRMARDYRQTPNTPAVPLFLALDQAVRVVLDEGVERRMARLAAHQAFVRAELRALGLELLLPDSVSASNVLTTAYLPDDVGYERLRHELRARGYVVYGGKGPLADRVIQVSALGTVDRETLATFFVVLADALAAARAATRSEISQVVHVDAPQGLTQLG
jgi:2-aminoethylphosphonate-pyruvate transaminase